MINQEVIDRIEQYLSHELSDSERASFEAQISKDDELAAEFQRRETAHLAMDFMISENLRSELMSLETQSHKVVSMMGRKKRMNALAIAASVVIIIGAFFVIMPSSKSSSLDLAMAYYEAPDYTLRGDSNALPSNISDAINALAQHDYQKTINLLEGKEDDYVVESSFYLGHAYFLSKRYDEAKEQFNTVISSNDLRYKENAEWYALLNCLAQADNCQEVLDSITEDNRHPYHDKALTIMKELNE